MKAPFLIGRALLGGFFLYNGINHLREYKKLAQYAGSKNVPAPQAGQHRSRCKAKAGGGGDYRLSGGSFAIDARLLEHG